mgnify:CR=1 FL=1
MFKDDFKVYVPGKLLQYSNNDRGEVIRIGKDQYNFLVDLYNESSLSMKGLIDTIIDQVRDHVIIEKREEE